MSFVKHEHSISRQNIVRVFAKGVSQTLRGHYGDRGLSILIPTLARRPLSQLMKQISERPCSGQAMVRSDTRCLAGEQAQPANHCPSDLASKASLRRDVADAGASCCEMLDHQQLSDQRFARTCWHADN
ncbi:hypothetical protein A5689_26655 [Mycobacterium intracellulare subsp. yongonense]|nr:hypothetical protein A5689_26655 [Mycobacterium intracellulare subsp. yongonense]